LTFLRKASQSSGAAQFQFELRANYRNAKAIIRAANKLKPNSQAELDYAFEGGVYCKE